jgi:signal peptidase I
VFKFWYGLRLPFVTDTVVEWGEPNRGDVVVFTRPDDPRTPHEDDSAIHIIKRVVGLPGDTVEVRPGDILERGDKPSGVVLINGNPIEEPYAQWVEGGNPEGQFGPTVIPPGHVLLLGDNRDQSKDSRFWSNPFLDIKRIKGKAVIIFWSWDSPKRIGTIIR